MKWELAIDDQSQLTEEKVKESVRHILSGGSIVSLAAKLRVSRKTIYYWRKKYPDFALEMEVAKAKLLYMYERILWATTVGADISCEYPRYKEIKPSMVRYQLKRLYPEYYNPRSPKFKRRIERARKISQDESSQSVI